MRKYHNHVAISVQPSFWVMAICLVLVLPLRWGIGWLIAVMVHEIGHVLGIVMFRISILSVSIKSSGVYVRTSQMLLWQESIVALLGPLFSAILLLFAEWFPFMAICAIVQLAFNLLPFECFDGGRVLRGVLRIILPSVWARCCILLSQTLAVIVLLVLGMHLHLSFLAYIVLAVLVLRVFPITFPCKQGKQIVQWSK